MAGCGFTPAAIDAMGMHDVIALLAFWRETPPVGEVMVAVHGIKPAPAPDRNDPSGIGALIAQAPDGRIINQ